MNVMRTGSTLFALVALTACGTVRPSPEPGDETLVGRCIEIRADSLMRARMAEKQVAGASVAVFQRGQFLKRTAYGHANLASGELVRPETSFFIASITKAFTAAAIMRLVEEGRLELDAPVPTLIPDVPAAWQQITVRHLLSSTSGLPGFRMFPGTYPASYTALLDSIRGKPLLSEPGSRYRYDAPNYELLNDIIERVSGRSFARLVEERLLNPLRIRSARFGGYAAIRSGVAEWYSTIGVRENWEFADTARYVLRTLYPQYMWPSAGMHISAPDLVRWVGAFADGQVVSRESVNLIWSPIILSTGAKRRETFGAWVADSTGDWRTTNGGARAAVTYSRQNDLAVAVLTNTQGANPIGLASAIAELYVKPPTSCGPEPVGTRRNPTDFDGR